MSVPGHAGRIAAHYQEVWGHAGAPLPPPVSPRSHELPEDFAILRFEPRPARQMWAYATCGMSQVDDVDPIELHMFSPEESTEIVELLAAVAHYHRTGRAIGLGHTVNFGKPWIGVSECDHGLISVPYPDGPNMEDLRLSDKLTVKFGWLVPITAAEVDYKKVHGLEALEQRLEDVAFLDQHRRSVC